MRYALVNKQTKLVENIVEWDGNTTTWQPHETYEAITTADKPTVVWAMNEAGDDYDQVETIGNGGIGKTWDGTKFVQVDKPELFKKPTNEEQSELRRAAYIAEADPLFFKTQRGEVEQQVWLDKIAEIKARFPK
jgi:hypothetical protein